MQKILKKLTQYERSQLYGYFIGEFIRNSRSAGIYLIVYNNLNCSDRKEYAAEASWRLLGQEKKLESAEFAMPVAKALDLHSFGLPSIDEAGLVLERLNLEKPIFIDSSYENIWADRERLMEENRNLKRKLEAAELKQSPYLSLFTGVKKLILQIG